MQKEPLDAFSNASGLPSLEPLPGPPSVIPFSTILLLCFLTGMLIWSIVQQSLFGIVFQSALIVVNVVYAIIRYRSLRALYRQYINLKAFEKICNTPLMREEGNSIIFTYLVPSEKLVKDIRETNEFLTGKKMKE